MDRPYGPVHSRWAVVAKHPTGVYLQGSWVQGEQASPFFFSFKKKGEKPLRAKSCPFGAVALRDAAAAAEMRPPVRIREHFALCGGRPGRRPDPEPFGHVGYAQPFEKGGPKL